MKLHRIYSELISRDLRKTRVTLNLVQGVLQKIGLTASKESLREMLKTKPVPTAAGIQHGRAGFAKVSLILFLLFFPVWIPAHSIDNRISVNTRANEQDSLKWQELTSVEDLHAIYPERVELVLENLDLEREGLEKVKQAYKSGNTLLAGKHLLEYYKGLDIYNGQSREVSPLSDKTVPVADSIVQDIVTIQGISDQVPRLENGHLDWDHTGPADDMEYAWLHNRHSTVSMLLEAWLETRNPKYARYIDHYIKDWIISSWPYPAVKSSTAMWRGLEVTGRVRNWRPAFFKLIDTEYLSPATQLLILSSLPEHAHYLRNFHAGGNWLTMEISGLATVAAYWPEFKKSSDWLRYSIDTMTASMKEQVYPDEGSWEVYIPFSGSEEVSLEVNRDE